MAMTTAALVAKFIALDTARKKKDKDIKDLKEELAVLEAQLLERMRNAGQQSIKTSEGVTLFVERTVWASATEGGQEGLCEALKGLGFDGLVKETTNSQTLSAYVREQETQYRDREARKAPLSPEEIKAKVIPAPMRPWLNVSEVFKIKTRG